MGFSWIGGRSKQRPGDHSFLCFLYFKSHLVMKEVAGIFPLPLLPPCSLWSVLGNLMLTQRFRMPSALLTCIYTHHTPELDHSSWMYSVCDHEVKPHLISFDESNNTKFHGEYFMNKPVFLSVVCFKGYVFYKTVKYKATHVNTIPA